MPDPGAVACELLVMDGGSRDDTCAIVRDLSARDPRIRLIRNERRIQASGVNLAAHLAHPDSLYLVRADSHATYPAGWVKGLVDTMHLRGAASVVVPLRTIGVTPLQRAIAAAQNSRLGNGGSAHRLGGISGYVSHGHHAGFDRRAFLRVGGYDESFSHNEDAELDRRFCAAGDKIYLAADLIISYFPRTSLRELVKQYFSYGRGCARTLEKHKSLPKLRQTLPPIILIVCLLAFLLSVLKPIFLSIPFLYTAICCLMGVSLALRYKERVVAISGPVSIAMHMSWAAGFMSNVRYQRLIVHRMLNFAAGL